MLVPELARPAIALAMLSVASYHDIRTRQVSDTVWILFCLPGAALYFFDSQMPDMLSLGLGVAVGIAGLASRALGQADCLALIATSVIMPTANGIPAGPAIALVAPVLASSYRVCANLAYNFSDLFHGRLFLSVQEKPHRKALAFLVLHRRRQHERFVFCAQDGCRFVFYLRNLAGMKFAGEFDGHVISAVPMVPFMALTLISIYLPFF